mmetsp:Transcript_16668/g.22939  ORF Transcript_16668/g.22939 Transcript_16668/m.22939 type:complete len:244 (+) Transcript_16668:15-746(+)|eukprot:CAMPEP_0201094644 /NCGR_PEP_ID=MMETSP0812-20130820/3036_1 /ASSEMBLY_ACC=CAM_ASM_000668 /TAXON_ID=98059 /ORGANISM="Dinobryon sp., Strain UTEXLB2267" /LENGTH=243 /DNA_ID=CAMNT_0047347417 /DNA_START=6 /DNA_END=737 /DNA_ORIENTATION=-
MDIVQFKRNQEEHQRHLERVRNITPMVNTSAPESLGLKHLAFRPKKQQLIDDNRHRIAKDNAKMMENMAKHMSEKRPQPKYVKPSSLNEVERKLQTEKLNLENSLILNRIKNTPPVISTAVFEEDFKRHLKAESVLRRRQMKPISSPKQGHSSTSSLFDNTTYSAQHMTAESGPSSDLGLGGTSPIKTMSEFRKHVISSKRMQHSSSNASSNSSDERNIGEMNMSSLPDYNNSDAIFEMRHAP